MALIGIFESAFSKKPSRVFVTGVSEGGLIATKALEEYPAKLNGGLAACAPIGDFRRQIDYFGDARVLFDYFFPGVLGDRWTQTNITIPPGLMLGWESTYVPAVASALQASPLKTAQLISAANIPVGLNPANAGEAIVSALWYNVFATNDAMLKLGGNPFDNSRRWYSGSLNDILLNLRVARFTAKSTALENLKLYQTSGNLKRPLVTLHTVWDPVVPAWQESLYAQKVAKAGSSALLVRYPVLRFGHCAFNEGEVLIALLTLVMHPYSY
jgi:alpha-beta hydrolase superfamily lysophospholipase